MRSIRADVARTLALGLGGLLVTLNATVGWVAWGALARAFDDRLEERARALSTLVVQKGPYVELEISEGLMPAYGREDDPDYFQIWILGEGGGVLERSERLGAVNLPGPSAVTGSTFQWLRLPDGRAGRAVCLSALIHEYEPVNEEDGKTAARRSAAVTVATSRGPLERARLNLLGWLLGADALFVLGSVLVVATTLRRGLAPITAFTERVALVRGPDQLTELHASSAPLELRPIAESIEAMLARLRAAFARERRLSGDIAHELRTPIAELRLAADVALDRPDDRPGLLRAVEDARQIAIEMDRTISMLLRLWRDEQAREQSIGVTELGAVLSTAMRSARPIAEARGIVLPNVMIPSCEVAVAERPLALILANLVQNAASHGLAHTEVVARVEVDARRAVVHLENARAPEIETERALDPEPAAERGVPHAGLGLSLARALSDASAMELEVIAGPERFIARLSIPRNAGLTELQGSVRT